MMGVYERAEVKGLGSTVAHGWDIWPRGGHGAYRGGARAKRVVQTPEVKGLGFSVTYGQCQL